MLRGQSLPGVDPYMEDMLKDARNQSILQAQRHAMNRAERNKGISATSKQSRDHLESIFVERPVGVMAAAQHQAN